jgi:NitT/TauT family transport system permease protein
VKNHSSLTSFKWQSIALPFCVFACFFALWWLAYSLQWFDHKKFPTPPDVMSGFSEVVRTKELMRGIVASLYRVLSAFVLATIIGVPLGLWLGRWEKGRLALLPLVNFFRGVSPIAWFPFAIVWFGLGDNAVIFLITLAAIFPIALTTLAAVANIPEVYFRVAEEYGLTKSQILSKVTFPAILPQVLTGLRVTIGFAWVVMVAAEMIAGKDGLGYMIHDARNNLRPDLVVVAMFVIGLIGICLDRLLTTLHKLPMVRWGYAR